MDSVIWGYILEWIQLFVDNLKWGFDFSWIHFEVDSIIWGFNFEGNPSFMDSHLWIRKVGIREKWILSDSLFNIINRESKRLICMDFCPILRATVFCPNFLAMKFQIFPK